jgi:tetratricopeptide (TPR) repeat protein
VAPEVHDFGLAVAATHFLGQVCYALGDYSRASELLRQNALALQGDRARERYGAAGHPAVGSRGYLAVALAERGEFAEGLAWGEEGRRLAAEVMDPYNLITARLRLGELYGSKGDMADAIQVLTEALGLAEEYRIRYSGPRIASALGYALAKVGRLDEALPLLERAVERAVATNELGEHPRRLAWLAEAYLLAGRAGEASDAAEQALGLARRQSERGNEAWALRLLGEIAAHADPPDVEETERDYQQALSLADELGMRPLVAHCHLGLGTLYQKIGRREQAASELTTAAELYRTMEMTFWLERAEAELARSGAA